jgi:AcrR family transcriptional regulator
MHPWVDFHDSETSAAPAHPAEGAGLIIRAAFELMAQHGFADVGVTQIAERAEVVRMTYFRYFGDK